MALATQVSGGQAPDDAGAPPIQIVLHPAREPRPALKYQLLPPFLDRRPGNAAVHYLKVPHEQTGLFGNGEFWDTICKWIEMPLRELRNEKDKDGGKHTWIARSSRGIIENLDRSARCESCDWDLPVREREFYTILLPEVQSARASARILAARARLQIADGKYDDAVQTLQTGYALARHVAQGPCIVQGLVGAALAGMMSKQVETLIQQPGAPNLYWALASLPRPMIDLRLAFEAEMATVYLSYPELRDLDKKNYPPEYWRQLWDQTAEKVWRIQQDCSGKNAKVNSPTDKERLQMLTAAIEAYPRAKRSLIAERHSVAKVEAMPVHQVMLLHTMRTFEELRDDLFKWRWMPFAEVHKHIERADRQWKISLGSAHEIIPLASTFLPAITTAKSAEARTDRDLAALQILEAIRLYGAAHDGPLPAGLAEIIEVPIPPDPCRGEPFLYRREGDTAILESPFPGHPPEYTLRYQIRLDREGEKP